MMHLKQIALINCLTWWLRYTSIIVIKGVLDDKDIPLIVIKGVLDDEDIALIVIKDVLHDTDIPLIVIKGVLDDKDIVLIVIKYVLDNTEIAIIVIKDVLDDTPRAGDLNCSFWSNFCFTSGHPNLYNSSNNIQLLLEEGRFSPFGNKHNIKIIKGLSLETK